MIDSISYSVNDKSVCRTALATQGLLITKVFVNRPNSGKFNLPNTHKISLPND